MSKIANRLYFIEKSVLPKICASRSDLSKFQRAYSLDDVFRHVESSNHRTGKRNLRRDLEKLVDSGRVSLCVQNNKSRYYIEDKAASEKAVGNLPKHRTLALSDHGQSTSVSALPEHNVYPKFLTDAQLNERFIEKHGHLSLVPNPIVKEKVNAIRESLKNQWRLSFDYEKQADGGASLREVNPIGVINNCGNYILAATKKGGNVDEVMYYSMAKMSNLTVLKRKSHFPQTSVSQALEKLYSGNEDYQLTPQAESVSLHLKKHAADAFSNVTVDGAKNWNFKWINKKQRIANLSFEYNLTLNFIKGLSTFGSSIEVIGSQRLKEALRIQSCVSPNQQKSAMKVIFSHLS